MPEPNPQKRTGRVKRAALVCALFLVGGAIVNVAVAWAASISVWVAPFTAAEEDFESDGVHVWWKYQARRPILIRTATAYDTDEPPVSRIVELPSWIPRRSLMRSQEQLEAIRHSTTPAWHCVEDEAGWPLSALLCAYSVTTHPDGDFSITGVNRGLAVSLADQTVPPGALLIRSNFFGASALPFRPIWPGFIINTLFYTLLLWLLFFAPFAARRMLRRRRGQCEKCAYPIGVSPVCTECGAAVHCSERST